MTISETIHERVNDLKPSQQAALLQFLNSLEVPTVSKPRISRVSKDRKAKVKAAVHGIAGIWKDRTDLPKDPVEAVKVLRARMSSRGRHA